MRLATTTIFLVTASLAAAAERPSIFTGPLGVAADCYQSEKFKEAHAALDQFEKTNGPTAVSLDLRGCIQMEQGNLDGAAKAFEASRTADPSLFAPRLHTGDLLARQKQYAKAREIYDALHKDTNVMISSERIRFAILMTYLGERDENGARNALKRIPFPTQSPAYYYAQAAWAFAHNKNSEGQNWIKTAGRIYDSDSTAWFARFFYDQGWLKKKPPVAFYHS